MCQMKRKSYLITKTGCFAELLTRSATEPIKISTKPPLPFVPITIKSTLSLLAKAILDFERGEFGNYLIFDDDAIQYGRKLYRRDLNRYAECLNANEWPSVDQTPQILSLPSWVYKEVL